MSATTITTTIARTDSNPFVHFTLEVVTFLK